MKSLKPASGLTERVYAAILDEILNGALSPGQPLVQEQLAADLGVSRQPVQQAMALLKADGMVEQTGRRGLAVAALDLGRMQAHYDLRGLIDGYAARAAAGAVRDGLHDDAGHAADIKRILDAGDAACRSGSTRDQIRQDEAYHRAIYAMSGNAVIDEAAEPHWRFLRRAMAEVLRHAEPPAEIWDQHRAIAGAIFAGDGRRAEALALDHTRRAAGRLSGALRSRGAVTA